MAKVIGKSFVNDNKGLLDADGYWVVTVIMTETFYYDDETSKEEVIEVRSMDRDFILAHQLALATALNQYREEVYDKGEQSLIEAREKNGKPTESSANTDTLTQ